MIALFLAIVAGAAYLAFDRWVWEGGLPDLISSKGSIEANRMKITGKFSGLVQELWACEGTTVQEGQVLIRLDHRNNRALVN